MLVLGIETTCDETAAAVVRRTGDGRAEILSNVIHTQTEEHRDFGGVVPEIAARAHVELLDTVIRRAMDQAGVRFSQLDAVAAAAGPGLIGGVIVGLTTAKAIALVAHKPLVAVNHLEAHALTIRMTHRIGFPYLLLLVSGGHTQLISVEDIDRYRYIGGTVDDAIGEAFDKTAKLLGLPQPGGPSVETEARSGDPARFAFPRPLLDRSGCDLSFSGLKTALLRARDAAVTAHGGLTRTDRADLCAGFQAAVADVLAEKSARAIAASPGITAFAVAGGVAANAVLRARLTEVAARADVAFLAPPLRLCTDNAAMIAWAGIERFRAGGRDDLTLSARPRWPLDNDAPAMLGSGKRGAKA
jgi:N6-L-threonylcarbamoyladenine synthase